MGKVFVKKEICIGCGTCAALCPNVFRMNGENKAEVIDENGDTPENIKMAADSCPVGAIEVGEWLMIGD